MQKRSNVSRPRGPWLPLEVSDGLEPILCHLAKLSELAERNPRLNVQIVALALKLLKHAEAMDNRDLWAVLQFELAAAYANLPTGDLIENLERARACYENALQVYTFESSPLEYAVTCLNLGNIWSDWPTGDRSANLHHGIACFGEALRVLASGNAPLDYAATQNNLGVAYHKLLKNKPSINVQEILGCFQEALRFRHPKTSPWDYATTQYNLGNLYLDLSCSDRDPNVRKAIACFREALRFRTLAKSPVEFAITQNSLGVAYAWLKTGEKSSNLNLAIACFRQAFLGCTPDNAPVLHARIQDNLGSVYSELTDGDRVGNLERACVYHQQALDACRREETPALFCTVAQNLGYTYSRSGRWHEAHLAYRQALAAEEMLYQAAASTDSRRSVLAQVEGLFRNDAYCLGRLGMYEAAVERLESGRARALAEALALDGAALHKAAGRDRAAFHTIRETVRNLEMELEYLGGSESRIGTATDYAGCSDRLAQMRRHLSAIVDRIRSYVPDFMVRRSDLGSIAQASDPECPLVYLVTTFEGSLALIVPPQVEALTEDHVVWLDTFTETVLNEILLGECGRKGYLHSVLEERPSSLYDTLGNALPLLGEMLMLPVKDRLASLGFFRCTLVSCGRLALVPLHAARLSDGWYLDQALELSYAPCARVLQYVRQRIPKTEGPTLFAVVDPPHRQEVSLGELTLPLSIPRLPYSHMEATAVGAVFPEGSADVLWGVEATRSSTLAQIGGRSYLHFSCHGLFSPTEPLMSALMLAGEDRLTLADILNCLDLSGARLAVLSACQTAITEFQRVPDEAIGLPAGFLQAGVRGVVGSLWPVHDMSTALLMGMFYRYHLQEGLSPAAALRRAQQWLRESTVDELDLVSHLERRYQESGEADRDAFKRMAYYREHRQEKPFAHPYYWAAFAYYGAAQ